MVINCTQEKKFGAILLSTEELCPHGCTVLRRRNWCSTRRRDLVLYCSQEKKTGAEGERNWSSTVLRIRDLVLYCSQEKETGALLFSGENCSQEKATGALLSRRKKLVLHCFKGEGEQVHYWSQ